MRLPLHGMLVCSILMLALPAHAQETEIENDVPISAEATTAVVPGKEADVAPETGHPAATAKPDRIYTDGMLSNPEPKAEDLGLASPGQKMKIDVDSQGDAAK